MNGSKNRFVTTVLVLSVSLIVSSVSIMLASCYFSRLQFGLLNAICCEWLKQEPEAEKIITGMLKEYTQKNTKPAADTDFLSNLAHPIFRNLRTGLSLYSQRQVLSQAFCFFSLPFTVKTASKPCESVP